jgi:aminopeptidase N
MYFVGSEEKIICKFGHKDKENTPVIGFRVLMMWMKSGFNLTIASMLIIKWFQMGFWKKNVNAELANWKYNMNKPMSSICWWLPLGNLRYTVKSQNTEPVGIVFGKKDAAKFEPTYRYSSQIFNWKPNKVKYPWKIYKQIPVRFLIWEWKTLRQRYLLVGIVDSIGFEDRNYINVNAHELAHQWFGNLITAERKTSLVTRRFCNLLCVVGGTWYLWWWLLYSKLYQSAQQIKYALKDRFDSRLEHQSQFVEFYQKGLGRFCVAWCNRGFSLKKAVRSYLKSMPSKRDDRKLLRWSKKSLRLWLGQIPQRGLSHQSLTIIQLMFYWIK